MQWKVGKGKRQGNILSIPVHVLVVYGFFSLFCSPDAGAQPKPGETLGQETWQTAKGLMPESILRRFADGSYHAKVITLPSTLKWGSKFAAATEANAGKFSIDAEGSLIDNA